MIERTASGVVRRCIARSCRVVFRGRSMRRCIPAGAEQRVPLLPQRAYQQECDDDGEQK
jgi:hypothetical protein